jgi:YVTN family beta-propeller protein
MKLWADRKRLYIAGSYGYAVIDLATRRVAHSTEYGREGEFASPMRAIAFLPRQSQYVVTDHFGLHVYDAGTDKEIRYLNLHRIADPIHSLTSDIAVTSDGKTAYLAMWDEGAVLALDTATWEVRARIDTGRMPFSGATPRWLSLSPGRSELYVVCEEGDRVVVIDTATRQVTAVIRLDQ